jgi:hypothetical protein
MSTSSLPLAVGSNGAPKAFTTGDTLTFNTNVVFAGTVSGVTATSVSDGTGSAGFLGSAGAWSSSGITTMSMSGTGNSSFGTTSTGTLSLRSATGTSSFGDGTGILQFDGAGALSASSVTSITFAGGTGSNVSYTAVGSGTFTSRSATGSYTFGDGTGTGVFSGAGAFSTTGITSYDLDASGAIQINSSGGAISIGNDNVNQNISIGTQGSRTISVGSSSATIALKGPVALSGGTNAAPIAISMGKTAGATLAVGDVLCYIATSGKMDLADADSATAATRLPAGSCTLAAAADAAPTTVAFSGEVPVKFASAPAAASIGAPVYLSETAGRGTLTAPTTAGSDVWYLGILAFADGADTVCRVLWQPALRYSL